MEEAQAFFNAVVKRHGVFPLEWELPILRTSVVAFPDRGDLVERLAFVEEALAPGNHGEDPTSRLAFERAWVRFSRSDLVSPGSNIERSRILRATIDDARVMLSSPVFERLTLERQITIVTTVNNTLMSAPSPDLPIIAELGLHQFAGMLGHPQLTEAQACTVFDALHSLYFAGVCDVGDLHRFDVIVPAFEAWLEKRHGQHVPPPMLPSGGRTLTIAYLLHTAHLLTAATRFRD